MDCAETIFKIFEPVNAGTVIQLQLRHKFIFFAAHDDCLKHEVAVLSSVRCNPVQKLPLLLLWNCIALHRAAAELHCCQNFYILTKSDTASTPHKFDTKMH